MSIKESERYRAETFKTWGLILGTPFGMLILNSILTDLKFDWIWLIRFVVSILFLYFHFVLIDKGYDILGSEEEKEKVLWTKNQLSK